MLQAMYQNLTKKGINVPNGFAVSAFAYQYFVEHAGIKKEIKQILLGLDRTKIKDLKEKIIFKLKKLGFIYITLDLQGYRSGSMNEELNEKAED